MNPMGDFNPANYSASSPYSTDTGMNWEYIRIINNSPYLLQVTLAGQGSKKIPENFLEDIRTTRGYNGKLTIVPVVNFPASAIGNALSSLVSVECYLAGEIVSPVAQPITTLANVGGSVIQASQVEQFGQPVPTKVVFATTAAQGSLNPPQNLNINNDGSGNFGDTTSLLSPPPFLKWDSVGNFQAKKLTAAQPVVLLAGQQETGKCGDSYTNAAAGATTGPTVNFKCVMTNTPTSITLNTPSENVNANAPAPSDIDVYGFWLAWSAPGAGTSRYVNTYTTVGN